jgi:hypothetical protein
MRVPISVHDAHGRPGQEEFAVDSEIACLSFAARVAESRTKQRDLERAMSLPAAQQRILDGIADGLRASEPRLASMFAIFTTLTRNEAPPCREQLPSPPRLPGWLRAVGRAGGGLLAGVMRKLVMACTGRWRFLRPVLALGSIGLLAVLIVVNLRPVAGCSVRAEVSAVAIHHARGAGCSAQPGPASGPLVGK